MKPSLKQKLINHYAESYVDSMQLDDLNAGMQELIKSGVIGLESMVEAVLKKEIAWLYNDPYDYPTGLDKDEKAELMKFFGHRPEESEPEFSDF